MPLPQNLENVLPEIEEGAGQAINILFGDDTYLPLYAGKLTQPLHNQSLLQ